MFFVRARLQSCRKLRAFNKALAAEGMKLKFSHRLFSSDISSAIQWALAPEENLSLPMVIVCTNALTQPLPTASFSASLNTLQAHMPAHGLSVARSNKAN